MGKPYTILNETHTTLASEFVHGTDNTMVLTDASNFDSGGGYVRVETTDGEHWALYEYTGISTNTLTGLALCALGIVESDVDYTFPAASLVGRAIVAEDVEWMSDECGNGADGDVTISSNTTLTRHMNYNNLTVESGKTLSTAGFTVYVKGTLANSGTISAAGNAGGNASGATGGVAGTPAYTAVRGLVGVPSKGGAGATASGAGVASGSGGAAGSVAISATTAAILRVGSGGGGGGSRGESPTAGAAGGSIGIGHAGGAGANAGGTGDYSDGGGGGGGGGGCVILVVNEINNAGTITANGGVGGNAGGSRGGGGGGGGAGTIFIRYRSTTGSGLGTRTVTGGAAGSGYGSGNAGSNGVSVAEQIA
jgi:hypothetical protein